MEADRREGESEEDRRSGQSLIVDGQNGENRALLAYGSVQDLELAWRKLSLKLYKLGA